VLVPRIVYAQVFSGSCGNLSGAKSLAAWKPAELVHLSGEANALTAAVGGPAAGIDQGVLGQGNDVQQRRFNRLRPLLG
jgi:hypothetical protein